MRALICRSSNGLDDLKIEEIPTPTPGKDEVLVKVKASGINFTDLLLAEGKYQFKPEFPFSPGAEIAGHIIQLGQNVNSFEIGDFIAGGIGWGGLSEYVVCKAHHLVKISQNANMTGLAGSMVGYGTAHHALFDRGQLKPNEKILILGASGVVGTASIKLAKALGCFIICTCSSKEKGAFCRQNGAHEIIQYQDIKKNVKNILQGEGTDLVLDLVGGNHSTQAIRTLRWKGRYLVAGFASGTIPELPLNLALLKGIDVKGVFWSRFKEEENSQYISNQLAIIKRLEEMSLTPLTTEVISLDHAVEAMRDIKARKAIGKIVVEL